MQKNYFYDVINESLSPDRASEFKDWLLKEGVLMPKLSTNGETVTIKDKINNREAFLFVPYKMIISVNKTLDHEILGPIINNHPEIFDEEDSDQYREQFILLLALIYEIVKEEDSYWCPYLKTLSYSDFPLNWDKTTIEQL